MREMVNSELGKEIKKDFFSSCHERGTKKRYLYPLSRHTEYTRPSYHKEPHKTRNQII